MEEVLTHLVLMARSDETFKENPAGLSSVLFYHATIIIHGMIHPHKSLNILLT